jgi:ribonuclease R
VLAFIEEAQGRVSKREIARAFRIKGNNRTLLKNLIKELRAEGAIARDPDRSLRPAGRLPPVGVIEITGANEDGDLHAVPQDWRPGKSDEEAPPRIILVPTKQRKLPALGKGDKVLARLSEGRDEEGVWYAAQIIRVLGAAPSNILGVYHGGEEGGRISPTEKKLRKEFAVNRGDEAGARHGELVLAEIIDGRPRRSDHGLQRARVTERLGDMSEPRSVSLIAIHHHGIPTEFPPAAIAEAEGARAPSAKGRTDLRAVPLITIDPANARDHDDAIFAQADDDPKNKGGWQIMVAIADVAHFVTPGSALDKEALTRGNSCYFPDRVVPMLPEALSNDLCSLKVGQDRAALVAHMWLDKDGKMIRHKFERALIRSAASLTYQEAQAAIDGHGGEKAAPLLETVLKPLYGAFAALMRARLARQPLELDLPERRIVLGEDGHVESIDKRERLDAHKVVEEFMVTANVAAAETLEQNRKPCMYRVHEEPGAEKLESLREFLSTLDLRLAKAQVMRPALLNNILRKAADTEYAELVNDVMLRSQTQAYYAPENRGHFGLALTRYAHFTSPIRRYADLVVHRGLVSTLGSGKGGLVDGNADPGRMTSIGEEISKTERRAMAAERESVDRYLAAFLSDQVGDIFSGKISGVARFGLFVSIEPSGADGIIPVSTLYDDFYEYDEHHHRLVGQRRGKVYRLGDRVEVRLAQADRYTGGLKLELLEEGVPAGLNRPSKRRGAKGGKKGKRGKKRGRPAR